MGALRPYRMSTVFRLEYTLLQLLPVLRHTPSVLASPNLPSQVLDVKTFESSRLELEGHLTSSKYERKKSNLEIEFVRFLSRLRLPKDLSTTSPRDIVHFLIWKDKDANTQVHQEGCPHFGSSSKITKGCDCPKHLAFKTVDSLIGQLRATFRDHRTTVHSPFEMSLPNPASHMIVKRYLKALTEEQLQARVLPQQAEPFFVHDLMILCSKIEGLLKGPDIDPTHVFIYARDLAYFKLHFFSGDRPSDLSHILTEEIMRFPQDKGLLFNHVFGKTLRSGDSNIFGIQRHPNVTLCHVKGIDDYMAVSHALGISLTSGYLFLTTQGNVVTPHPFLSDAAEARLKTYLTDLPIGKKTLYSF